MMTCFSFGPTLHALPWRITLTLNRRSSAAFAAGPGPVDWDYWQRSCSRRWLWAA